MARESNAWLTTFVDIIALLVTFFVLQISMSQFDLKKYNSFVQSLNRHNVPIQEANIHKGNQFRINKFIRKEGENIQYIETLLSKSFQIEIAENEVQIVQADGNLKVVINKPLFNQSLEFTGLGIETLKNVMNKIKIFRNPVTFCVVHRSTSSAKIKESFALNESIQYGLNEIGFFQDYQIVIKEKKRKQQSSLLSKDDIKLQNINSHLEIVIHKDNHL